MLKYFYRPFRPHPSTTKQSKRSRVCNLDQATLNRIEPSMEELMQWLKRKEVHNLCPCELLQLQFSTISIHTQEKDKDQTKMSEIYFCGVFKVLHEIVICK